jgi:saccharopine dehydrogenase-like NADP-dependent oxidoreductase
MSRTTAFPATIVAGLMLDGVFRRPGVHAPESLGREPGLLDRLLAELEARGVRCQAHAVSEEAAAPETVAVA